MRRQLNDPDEAFGLKLRHTVPHRTHPRKNDPIGSQNRGRILGDLHVDRRIRMLQGFRDGMKITHSVVNDSDGAHGTLKKRRRIELRANP